MATEKQIGVDLNFLGNRLKNIGYQDLDSSVIVTGNINVSPANNFNPTGLQDAAYLKITHAALAVLSGIAAPTTAINKFLMIQNDSGSNIQVNNNDASSLAANRFLTQGNFLLQSNRVACLMYDQSVQRWRVISLS